MKFSSVICFSLPPPPLPSFYLFPVLVYALSTHFLALETIVRLFFLAGLLVS
jgi:hypothetical protein